MKLQRTPLYKECLDAGGRMVPFAGWEMPVQFSSVIKEHQAVRNQSGMFDISHMGIIRIEGTNAKQHLQKLVPSDLQRIGKGEACYSVLLNENGGILDDLIIYDLGISKDNQEMLLLIINAACTDTDTEWIKQHLSPEGISISKEKENYIFLAIQGPKSCTLLQGLTEEPVINMPAFSHKNICLNELNGNDSNSTFISRTGYTGEIGFELLLTEEMGRTLWFKLLELGVTPCGLGCRDTLRLEAGFHLYGKEMDSSTTPFEAGLGWLVHLEMPSEFIGRKVLETQTKTGVHRRLVGLELEGKAIARNNYDVFHEEKLVGKITSGSWSPTLNKAIAMAYVPQTLASLGNKLEVEIRGKKHLATLIKRPFYRPS